MENHQHLKDRTYYEDRYDKHTVEECLFYEEHFQKKVIAKIQQLPIEDQKGVIPNVPYIVAGERYVKREETINKWMERDRQRDTMLVEAKQPYSFCLDCSESVKCLRKSIDFPFDDTPERVEFMLHCVGCKKSKYVYEDGTEIPSTVFNCDKCGHELETSVEMKGKGKNRKAVYSESCKGCGYKSVREDKTPKPPTKADKEKFARDKEEYCLSASKGMDYKQWSKNLNELVASMKDKEDHKEAYKSLDEYKNLSVVALHKHLKPKLKKGGYDKIRFADPDMGRSVTIDFKVQDTKEDRGEHESKKFLKKAVKDALSETNWTLMTEGLTYRLGVLTGRLKGHESREQLIALAKSRASHIT